MEYGLVGLNVIILIFFVKVKVCYFFFILGNLVYLFIIVIVFGVWIYFYGVFGTLFVYIDFYGVFFFCGFRFIDFFFLSIIVYLLFVLFSLFVI